MQAELRKLAATLRDRADEYDRKKLVKTAQVIRATVGLTLLQRKLQPKLRRD